MAESRKLLLIRHGQPKQNRAKAVGDWTLSPQGANQVEELVARIRMRDISGDVFSSSEASAMESAKIISKALSKNTQVNAQLREINRRPFHDLSREEFVRLSTELFQHRYQPIVGNESADLAKCRFQRAIEEVCQVDRSEWQGERIVVTHGIVMALFLAEYNDIDPLVFWARFAYCDAVVVSPESFKVLEVIKKN